VLAAITNHLNNASVNEQTLWVLRNLAFNSDENTAKVGYLGGIEIVIESMKLFIDNAAVLEQGCGAIANLAVNDDNTKRIITSGGIEVTLLCMEKHLDAVGVQEQGCWIIKNLSRINDYRNLIGNTNAIALIILAMKKYDQNSDLLEQTIWALHTLAWFHDDNKRKISESGARDLVIAAKANFPEHTGVKESYEHFSSNFDN